MNSKVLLDLLAKLVELDTVNDPVKGKRVDLVKGERVAGVLEEGWGEKPLVLEYNGFPSLVYKRGGGRPIVLFLAHFDTVPAGPGWSRPPFKLTIEGDKAYGRGAADDKGNVAAITMAFRGFEPRRGTLIVAFTGDEEIGGSNGAGYLKRWLKDNGLWPDYLVNGDGSLSMVINRRRNAFNVVVRVKGEKEVATGCRASRTYRAVIRGKETMHAAYFMPGVDTHPLIEAAQTVRIQKLAVSSLEGEWVKSNVIPPSATLTFITGGCNDEVAVDRGLTILLESLIPLTRPAFKTMHYSDYGVTATPNVYRFRDGWHEVIIDVRAMAGVEEVREAYDNIAGEALGEATFDLKVKGGTGYLYTPKDSRLVNIATRVNRELSLPDTPVEAGGASDSRYFSPWGVEAIDYGPRGGNIHGPNEYVDIKALEKAVEFYRRLAEELLS